MVETGSDRESDDSFENCTKAEERSPQGSCRDLADYNDPSQIGHERQVTMLVPP